MLLGHWYLVLPSMDVSLLQSIVRVPPGIDRGARRCPSARWRARRPSPGSSLLAPSFRSYVFSIDGIFFWQRLLFGLIGPVVLAYMTWETAKLRSTQSATGILYVDLFMVMVGELVAKYPVLGHGPAVLGRCRTVSSRGVIEPGAGGPHEDQGPVSRVPRQARDRRQPGCPPETACPEVRAGHPASP